MKSVLGRGNKKGFPPADWATIGEKVPGHENLFGLIDYFLCQSVSSAEAERGFSVVKYIEGDIETCHTWKQTPCQSDESYSFWCPFGGI